jgi:hypothetical protein
LSGTGNTPLRLPMLINRCVRVSSFGNLTHFRKECRPEGAAERCLDCSIERSCPYSAKRIYLDDSHNTGWRDWPLTAVTPDVTEAGILTALQEGPYGRCVYSCDNDVVDHQVVNFEFEGGRTASFTMTAFSYETHRRIEIKGTKAELVGDLEENLIKVMPYGKKPFTVDIKALTDDLSYHSGGDKNLLIDFVRAVRDHTPFLTDINYSVESHYLAFDAETSRLNQGLVINTSKSWSDYEL